ncbi:uncharacterized protein LOC123717799 [Pieris brassicae]|uniref:uncharacterized protein LOC123717799 n=1 Tax=Pieris brassicae TaxID=7116 RepID=UPI001E65E806|nr:uncharacterized protein LOC123717799 [Pieris brassicae]
MTNQRWSADKNIQFINEYQREECLWDPNHPQYKLRDARDAAYKTIMKTMEMQNIKEVVGKIRSLRNTYNNELLKAKKSHTTGMGTNKLYISKISWLSHLDFLKKIDSNTREKTENAPNTQATSTSESESQDFIVPLIPTRNKRKIKDPPPKAVHVLEKATQHFSNATNDEFDLFGQTIAEQLRQLPLEMALETEEMLLSTVRRQRIKLAKQQTSTQQVRLPDSCA